MSEKKPLEDELLREILVEQFREVYESYTIGYNTYNVVIDFNSTADAERFVGLEGGIGIIVHDRIVLLDLYRLAAMGREWMRAHRYLVDSMDYEDIGRIKLFKIGEGELEEWKFRTKEWPTELSATFAAISAVWERVKG